MPARTVGSRKSKGRKFQQQCRAKVLEVSDSLRAEDVKSTSMGVTGPDLQLSPYAQDLLGIQVECKAWSEKRLPLYEFYEQAQRHGPHEPVVFVKNDRRKPLVILDVDYYLKLLKGSLDD